MHLGIYTNKTYDEKLAIAENLCGIAQKLGFSCEIIEDISLVDKCNILVVIGGDGTILHVCEAAAKANVPILSVNNGRLGFLSEIEIFEFEKALLTIKSNEYDVERRMMGQVDFEDKVFNFINEILVVRTNRNSIAKINVFSDGVYIDTYEGDGVIVSTPTGSTGYSLSSGGPILSPKIDALVLTPLCVHSLHNRSIVFNENEFIDIVVESRDDENSIYIDGKEVAQKVPKGAKMLVKKSNLFVNFIKINKGNFYEKLNKKLVQWNNFK
ncbi:MAG: NAD(+)/NADH kinase [Clostridia bacterium]|nr:NAD(+)/NADH kinase [Clostridia bacterium]